jgi:hypothetical protein
MLFRSHYRRLEQQRLYQERQRKRKEQEDFDAKLQVLPGSHLLKGILDRPYYEYPSPKDFFKGAGSYTSFPDCKHAIHVSPHIKAILWCCQIRAGCSFEDNWIFYLSEEGKFQLGGIYSGRVEGGKNDVYTTSPYRDKNGTVVYTMLVEYLRELCYILQVLLDTLGIQDLIYIVHSFISYDYLDYVSSIPVVIQHLGSCGLN